MRIAFLACLVGLLCLPIARRALAHAGELDPGFDQGGIGDFPQVENGSCLAGAKAVAVHPDGSIWIAG